MKIKIYRRYRGPHCNLCQSFPLLPSQTPSHNSSYQFNLSPAAQGSHILRSSIQLRGRRCSSFAPFPSAWLRGGGGASFALRVHVGHELGSLGVVHVGVHEELRCSAEGEEEGEGEVDWERRIIRTLLARKTSVFLPRTLSSVPKYYAPFQLRRLGWTPERAR